MKLNFCFNRIFVLMFFLGCVEKQDERENWANHIPFDSNFSISELESSSAYAMMGESRGFVGINQASGLAYSRKNPGFLWTHQDKNFDNSLFLLNASNGEIAATYKVSGTENRDWEDIEIASGPFAGIDYLYLGDIGDNDQNYENYVIYRFEEPKFEESHQGKTIELELAMDKISFRYPSKSYDVEALMVDPMTKDIHLVTKRELRSQLFVLPFPQNLEKETIAIKAGVFPFRIVTAGTVSMDGNKAIIKNYNQIFYWERKTGQSFVEMMADKPFLLSYNPKEEQGEAICFDPSGGYFTLSELANDVQPQLYHYSKN